MAESGSLENCCPGNGTVGSIPTLSANFQETVHPSHYRPGTSSSVTGNITIFRLAPNAIRSVCDPLSIPPYPGTPHLRHRGPEALRTQYMFLAPFVRR